MPFMLAPIATAEELAKGTKKPTSSPSEVGRRVVGQAFYPVASTSACAQYHHHQLLVCAFEARSRTRFCMVMTLG
ncbi:MAG: hypothetical protein V3S91_01755 [Gemmatimonadota bacterium]